MPKTSHEHIPLNRTFHELIVGKDVDDATDLSQRLAFGSRSRLTWVNLLSEYRVVILSEAGSGKTAEIRDTAKELRKAGKPAFFMRLEHVVIDFESAFEPEGGDYDAFLAYTESGEEGWLLLDSVDEARLHSPADFERAIRKLGRELKSVLQHTHIVISSRMHAWRPLTDLMLCKQILSYTPPRTKADSTASLDNEISTTQSALDSFGCETDDPYRIFALDDLTREQISAFLTGLNFFDIPKFLDSVDRKEAWYLTKTPLDLMRLVDYWHQKGEIGSRLELMESGIEQRLGEPDQNRREALPIGADKLDYGAQLVAASVTLSRQSAINVPDGANRGGGITIIEALPDWTDKEISALLGRPIFDAGIYSTVRFHHRSVREFLTAKWLFRLIENELSRRKVEGLLFQTHYGVDVAVPAMQPILPWLAIWDQRICEKTCRVAPNILFQYGDPSSLPNEIQVKILNEVCEQLADDTYSGSIYDYDSVRRFTNRGLAENIETLLTKFHDCDIVCWLLLRMIWQGEISDLAPQVKLFALESRNHLTRVGAFLALPVVCTEEDQAHVRNEFLKEEGDLDRDWLAELVSGLPRSADHVEWLLDTLGRSAPKQEFSSDNLSEELLRLVNELPIDIVPRFLEGTSKSLLTTPFTEEPEESISTRHRWLVQAMLRGTVRLIEARHPGAFEMATFSTLKAASLLRAYADPDALNIREGVIDLVPQWPELNHDLFWKDVRLTREQQESREQKIPVTQWYQVGFPNDFWSFADLSFESLCDDVKTQPLIEDKLVALSAALSKYSGQDGPTQWRSKLLELGERDPALESMVDEFMNPPAPQNSPVQRELSRMERQAKERTQQIEKNKREWKEFLMADPTIVKSSGKTGQLNKAQLYVFDRMRNSTKNSTKWSEGNWQSLIPEFGECVARSFRDGMVDLWRGYIPLVRSEGAPKNSTPYATIIGLTGVTIEARETPNWARTLSTADAITAMKYAVHELNGFPVWLPGLYEVFPDIVIDRLMTEIDYELDNSEPNEKSHYVLYDVSQRGDWLWPRIAPLLFERVEKSSSNVGNLRLFLNVFQGSDISDSSIAVLASENTTKSTDPTVASLWFAVWVGVDPEAAIESLQARLQSIPDKESQTEFAMGLVTSLVGSHFSRSVARQSYRTVAHMKKLYLLMLEYIREDEDIDRTGKGPYSPGLRDAAQNARNTLLAFIREKPCKEAFLALEELAQKHPSKRTRGWIHSQARAMAMDAADPRPWSPRDVREFNEDCERIPATHRELFALAEQRLLEIKYDLEEGDASIAGVARLLDQETELRNFLSYLIKKMAGGKYSISQEDEMADAKRTDIRFLCSRFDGPVPVELKIADKWSGPTLFERLENQLCGDYLRDDHSGCGIFLLVYRGVKKPEKGWDLPSRKRVKGLDALVAALQQHWAVIAHKYPRIDDVAVIGIDLSKRGTKTKDVGKKKDAKS